MRSFGVFVCRIFVVGCGDNSSSTPDAFLAQCEDHVDNDGDGTVDYPDDLGCEDAADESEDSTPKPQCNDGRDNDNDASRA